MTLRKVFIRAAKRVERGWVQGVSRDARNHVCLVWAICIATDANRAVGGPLLIEQYHQAYARIKKMVKCEPVVWNDTPGRMKAEVVSLLRRAARI